MKKKNLALKLIAVMVMVFAVLISGCANKEEEWKQAKNEFGNQWAKVNAIHEEGNKEYKQAWEQSGQKELQYVTAKRFYRLKEIMADVEASLQKAEKIAKESDNKQWKDNVAQWRQVVNQEKGEELEAIKPFMMLKNIVPKEDWNWNKEVKRPDIKEKIMNYQFHEKPDYYNRDFTISADEKAPWSSSDNQSKETTEKTVNTNNNGKAGIITGTEVRMREFGNTNSKILGYFDKGEKVTILENKNGWYRVQRSDSSVGWVSGDFCKQQ